MEMLRCIARIIERKLGDATDSMAKTERCPSRRLGADE